LFPGNPFATLDDLHRLQLEVSDLRQALVAATHTANHQRETMEWLQSQLAERGLRGQISRVERKIRRAVRRFMARPKEVVGDNKRAA
jgi:hypothetical protein